MDTLQILKQLEAERDRLNAAIALLSGLDSTTTKATAPKATIRKRRKMSPEARAKIAEAQRKRWARTKKKGA